MSAHIRRSSPPSDTAAGSPDSAPRTPARAWAGMVILLLPALLVAMDISVLFVAGPAIAGDLSPSSSQWLWMMDIYSFVMAGLLITMGNIGDRIGRRRLLLLGAALFGIASFAVAMAPTPEVFIAARALLGVGAATLAPSTLALIRSTFADPDHRRTAVGAWTAAFAGGAVVGPILGGLLLEHLWWGSVFLINVPVMILLLVAAPLLVPESRSPEATGFDLPGAVLSLGAIIAVVHAGKRLADQGADLVAVATAAGGVVLAVAAVAWMRRTPHPLIDLSLLTRPAFGASVATNALLGFTLSGMGLLAFTFLQTVHGMSPLRAAVVTLPTLAGTILGTTVASQVARRLRPAVLVGAGYLVGAGGLAVISTISADTAAMVFIAGYVVLTFGVGILATLVNSLVLETAPPSRTSAAAGTSETGMVLGEAMGIAAFGTIASAVYQQQMTADGAPAGLPATAYETVAGAFGVAGELPPAQSDAVISAAAAAFTAGLTTVALITSALLALGGLVVPMVLRGVAPHRE